MFVTRSCCCLPGAAVSCLRITPKPRHQAQHVIVVVCHRAGRVLLAALLYGFVVHFRVFPIIYALSFFLSLDPSPTATANSSSIQKLQSSSTSVQTQQQMPSQKFGLGNRGLFGWITLQGVVFGAVSASVFFILTGLFYKVYEMEFLHEALLYHASRTDHRHNFSIYFYGIYLVSLASVMHAIHLPGCCLELQKWMYAIHLS